MRVQGSIEGQVVHVRMQGGRRVATLAVNDGDGPTSIEMVIPDGCPDVRGRWIRADRYAHRGDGLYDCEWVALYGRPRRRVSRGLVLAAVLVILTLAVQTRRVFQSATAKPDAPAASSNGAGSGASAGVGGAPGETGKQSSRGVEKKMQARRNPSGANSTQAAQTGQASVQGVPSTTSSPKAFVTAEGREIIPAPPPYVQVSESPLLHPR